MKKIQKIIIFQGNNILKFAKTKILNKHKIKKEMNSSIYEKYMYPYLLSSYVNLTTKSYISLVGILMTSIFIYAILADFF